MPLLEKTFAYDPYWAAEYCGHTYSDTNKVKLYEQAILTAFGIQVISPLGQQYLHMKDLYRT